MGSMKRRENYVFSWASCIKVNFIGIVIVWEYPALWRPSFHALVNYVLIPHHQWWKYCAENPSHTDNLGPWTHLCQLPPRRSCCAPHCPHTPQQHLSQQFCVSLPEVILDLWLLNTENAIIKCQPEGWLSTNHSECFSIPNLKLLKTLLLHCLVSPVDNQVDASYLICSSLSHSVRDPPCWIKSSGLWIRRNNFFHLINCMT